jgi:AraC-like DNA-binding protein
MDLLVVSPLLSSILGLFLGIFISTRQSGLGSDKRVRLVLSSLIFLYAYTSFDYYLALKLDANSPFSGGSYLLYHLIGPLFYSLIVLYTKTAINFKKWSLIILVYTLFRWILFIPILQFDTIADIIASQQVFGAWFWIEVEYVIATLLNVIALSISYTTLKNTPLVLTLNDTQQVHLKWVKNLIILFITLQLASAFNTVINTENPDTFETYVYIETMLLTVFFFVLTYTLMHFPVFAFTGSYKDLSEETKKKYAHSSLNNSSVLFQQIETLMKEEQLYLDFEIKLNTLAEKLNSSVHHTSQAINENAHISFSDYVNQFRIEAAKIKLLEPNPDTIFAIYLAVGFNSKAAFYKAFRKNTDMTPSEFKKLNKPQ